MKHPMNAIRALAVAACAVPAFSSGLPAAEPPGVTAQVDALFAEWDTTVTPGCSMAASRNGNIVHERGYGMANLEHGVPNRPSTVFHVASVSKQFTAAAIAVLIREGKLSVDDPIRKYLPEMPQFDHVVTIGDLVHHTSGLRDHSEILELSGWRYYQDLVTTEDAMSVLAKQKSLLFVPGAKYNYSNTNYLLMSEIVQRVTGQSLREFAAARLFKPLGMQDSYFRDNFSDIVANFAAGYDRSGGTFTTSLTNFSIVGYSTLLTTVRDLMKWEENFYTGKVGGQGFIDLMHTRATLNDGKPNKYAFGIVVDEHRGFPSVEHSGGDAGYSTHLVRFPQQHLSVAVLCNSNTIDARGLAMRTAEIHLGLAPEPERVAPPAAVVRVSAQELAAKAGHYLNREAEQGLTLAYRDGRLVSVAGDNHEELLPLARHRYRMGDRWEIEFPRGVRAPAQLTLNNIYTGTQVLERVADFTPGAADLAAYQGTYWSDEIDAPFRIQSVDGRVLLRSIKFKAVLTPVTPELFVSSWTNVLFERDGSGQISGFRYGRKDEVLAVFRKTPGRE